MQTGARSTADLAVLLAPYPSNEGPSLTATALAASDPAGLAWLVQGPGTSDLIAVRRADASGMWTITLQGRTIATDAHELALRFGGRCDWKHIIAGAMVRGSKALLDHRYVCIFEGKGGSGDLTFSKDLAVVNGLSPTGYYIGPVIPARQILAGVSGPAIMLNVPAASSRQHSK